MKNVDTTMNTGVYWTHKTFKANCEKKMSKKYFYLASFINLFLNFITFHNFIFPSKSM